MINLVGPTLLIVAAGVILLAIGLFWQSLRMLGGELPLDGELASAAARRHDIVRADDKKAEILTALRDLQTEHAIGRLDDADFAELSARYREEAKALMREVDSELEPYRARAEELVRDALLKARRQK